MITREQKFRLGVFLFISIILLIAVLAVFILPKFEEKGDTYFVNFTGMSVNGVNEGADVKYQGVRIGKVIRMEVNPEDLSSILVFINIQNGFTVKEDMRAKLQYAGITGLRFVEISGGTSASQTLRPGSQILMGKGLGEKAEDIVLNVDSLVDAVNKLLNPDNRKKISTLFSNLERSSGVMARLLEKREKKLHRFFEDIEQTGTQLNEIAADLKNFSQYLGDVTKKLDLEAIGKNSDLMVRNIAARFSDRELGKVIEELQAFVASSNRTLRKLETGFQDMEGGIDKTLDSLRESLGNISRFTRELTEDPTILLRTRHEKRSKK